MRRSYLLLLLIASYGLGVLLSACNAPSLITVSQKPQSTSKATVIAPMAQNATGTPSPALPADCPASGTGRPAAMAPLTTPVSHQNSVFIDEEGNPNNPPTAGVLMRYDVTTGSKTTILKLEHANIEEASLSNDGQWILFVDQVYDSAAQYYKVPELQLVRVDGQRLQTLYCDTQSKGLFSLAWSPDQQHIAFFGGEKDGESFAGVSLFDMRSGQVQLVLDEQSAVDSLTWQDNQRLYIRLASLVPTATLYLLDTARGAKQQRSDLAIAFQQRTSKPCWSADKSADGSVLFISQCTPAATPGSGSPYLPGAPSSMSKQTATGGSLHTILNTEHLAIVDVHVATPRVLLFTVANPVARGQTDSHNGLWKVNTDGSGLQQLTHEGTWSGNGQPSWANVSRDGMLYAYRVWDQTTQSSSIKYGVLSGNPTTTFAIFTGHATNIIGWTVM